MWDMCAVKYSFKNCKYIHPTAHNPAVILDGGHNYDGVANLCASVRELWRNKAVGVVYAAMRDKDYAGCLELQSLRSYSLPCVIPHRGIFLNGSSFLKTQ